MHGGHQLGQTDQQNDRREHLAHDDKSEEELLSGKIHAGHGVCRRNAAEHRQDRCAAGDHQRVQKISGNAAVDDVDQVLEFPFRWEDMQEIHIQGFRIGTKSRDQHDVVRIQRHDADDDDKEIQKPPKECAFYCAEPDLNGSQQHQEETDHEKPQHPGTVETQLAKDRIDVFAGAAAEQKPVDLGIQYILSFLHQIIAVQIDPAAEGVGVHHGKHGNGQQRDQTEPSGSSAQHLCAFRKILRKRFRSFFQPGQHADRSQDHAGQHDAQHMRRGKGLPQKCEQILSLGFTDGEGY